MCSMFSGRDGHAWIIGWGLVLASNTQPILVMRFEAATKELLEEYRREIEDVVEAAKLRAQGVV